MRAGLTDLSLADSATPARYGRVAITLHWLLAAMIVTSLGVGLSMVGLPFSPLRLKLFNWHKWLGVLILSLSAVRLLWRLLHPPPPLPVSLPRAQALAAKASHVALYAAMLAMPLLGWAMLSAGGYPVRMTSSFALPPILSPDPALYSLLRQAHGWMGYALFALILLHMAAALHHAWVRRDGVFEAMARGRSRTATTVDPDPQARPEA